MGTARCRGSRVAERPKTSSGDADAERLEPRAGVLEEQWDRPAHRLRVGPRDSGSPEVTVAREADVVELDLVEAQLRGLHCDVDVVLPDPRSYGFVQPSPPLFSQREPSDLRMASAGARADKDRVLEGDDAADQVEAGLRGSARPSVGGCSSACADADPARERDVDGEPDLAVLVLDVELDRVQPVLLQREVSWSFPGRPARAIVMCTPRTSFGSGRGCRASAGGGGLLGAGRSAHRLVAADFASRSRRRATAAAISASRAVRATIRCCRRRCCCASSRRRFERALGSTGWRT